MTEPDPLRGAPDPDLPLVARTALHDDVEAHLRRYIVRRGLRPGDPLPTESELSAALGTSRVIVREALRSLEAVGLVRSRAGSGRYLRAFDASSAARTFARTLAFHPDVLSDLLAVRRAVEGEAAGTAAARIAPAQLAELDGLVDRMRARIARGDRNFPEEDGHFHRILVEASGNQVALALMEVYWATMRAVYRAGFPPPAPAELAGIVDQHAAIANALRRRNAAAVRRALDGHQEEAARRFAGWQTATTGRPGRRPAGGRDTGDTDDTGVQHALTAALLGNWGGGLE